MISGRKMSNFMKFSFFICLSKNNLFGRFANGAESGARPEEEVPGVREGVHVH